MAGAPGPEVGAARAVFGLSGHFGEHGFEVPVRFLAAPRHERRPAERAFFSAAHSHAKKAQAGGFQFLRTALGVFEVGIAAIDNDVLLAEVRPEVVQDRVHGLSRGDHHPNAARPFQRLREFFERRRDNDILAVHCVGNLLGLVRVNVKARDGKALALGVHGQVFSHHPQSDDAEMLIAHDASASAVLRQTN